MMKRLFRYTLALAMLAIPLASRAALRTSAAAGNFTSTVTWGGTVPVAGSDTFAIGHAVVFDATVTTVGASAINAGGSLTWSTAAGTHQLILTGNLTGVGTLSIGTSTAVPYPATCLAKIDIVGNCSISLTAQNAVNIYCTQPAREHVRTTALANAGQTTLTVGNDVSADAPWLVSGATVSITDSATPYTDTEERTIASISATAITITAGLTASKASGSVVCLLYRNVQITGSGSGGTGYGFNALSGGTINALVRAHGRGFTGMANTAIGGVVYGNGIGMYTMAGGSMSGAWVNNSNHQGLSMGTFINGLFAGNGSYCLNAVNGCYFGSSFKALNNTTHINNGTRNIFSGCELGSSDQGIYQVNNNKFYNCLMSATTEHYSYNRVDWNNAIYNESYDHDQVVGAFRAWSVGGIVDKVSNIIPAGKTFSYKHALESATRPCFRQCQISIEPGAWVRVNWWMRKDASMVTLPKVELIDISADPLVDATQSALASATMTDVTDTWQSGTINYKNTLTRRLEAYVRVTGQNGSGNLYELTTVYPNQVVIPQ